MRMGWSGYNANLPGPGKRPLSSMTPTIVLKDGKPFLITGSPGGSRIISAVLQVIVNAIDFKMPIGQAVSAPRLHQQWQPEDVYVEPGFAPDVLDALEKRGHKICSRRLRTPRRIPLRSLQRVTSAPPTGARGAPWQRDFERLFRFSC